MKYNLNNMKRDKHKTIKIPCGNCNMSGLIGLNNEICPVCNGEGMFSE